MSIRTLAQILPQAHLRSIAAPALFSSSRISSHRSFSSSIAAMSAQLYEYVVIIPDKDDAECVNRRVAVRQEHLVGVKKLFADGVMTSGGAYLDGPITTESTPSFKGSVVTMLAESKEQVKEIMMKDVYSTNDVWDWEKAQIFNFACAVRKAKE